MAKLANVRLSTKSETKVADIVGGIGGKANTTKNGIPFVILEFVDDANVFNYTRATRLYYGTPEGKWSGATPDQLLAVKDKEIPGEFVTHAVAPYKIKGNDGVERSVGTYTTFVMKHENWLTVFTQDHDVVDDKGVIIEKGEKKPQKTANQMNAAGVKA